MLKLVRSSLVFATILSAFLMGCEITSEAPTPPDLRPASHVVINEVFTLPSTSQTPYSWIEFLNPTRDTVDIANWALSFSTFKQQIRTIVVVDSLFQFRLFVSQTSFLPQFGSYDVPFAKTVSFESIGIQDTVLIPPNGLYTIVTNEQRLLDHTQWGPGPSSSRFERPLYATVDSAVIVQYVNADSVIVATYQTIYGAQLQPTDQLLLKDQNGNVVDVVRYGNYTYQGPGTDPYSGNHAIGALPEFQSIARYAGGYFTGNTAVDFYVTRDDLPPIPNWYSQAYRR